MTCSASRSKKCPPSAMPSRPFSMMRKNGSSALKSSRWVIVVMMGLLALRFRGGVSSPPRVPPGPDQRYRRCAIASDAGSPRRSVSTTFSLGSPVDEGWHMGLDGYAVIDADGHGGEPLDWRERVPNRYRPQMEQFVARMKGLFGDLPGGAMRLDPAHSGDRYVERPSNPLRFDPEGTRPGMFDPAARIEDMDLEGIDISIMFGGGAGEEWALLDPPFAAALCTALNDARAEFCSFAPDRLKLNAKLPMIDPEAAASELERCVRTWPGIFVGMSTTQHVRERNLDDRSFDVVWSTAEALDVAVSTHGGGQAVDQIPYAIERSSTRLDKHAITHPFGSMLAVTNFTVGGVLHRFPNLRVGFM